MRIVITGAAGAIGRAVVEELHPLHDVCLIDIRPIADRRSIVADLSIAPSDPRAGWSSAFENAQVVIHLAANVQPLASWEKILPDNIEVTWNVLEAAANHRVKRIVFASSNWAVKALEEQLAPACYNDDGPKIGSDASASPVNAYGLSKGFGELAGRMLVDQHRLESFIAVRIGNFNLTPASDEAVRARWIGIEDMKSLMRRCVEAELKGFHVVYGVSRQLAAPYDLSYTRQQLGWEPKQSA